MIRLTRLLLASFLLAMTTSVVVAETADVTRIRDLRSRLGQEVTVRGRSGIIVEAQERPGLRVYTLRDDYGDQVYVQSTRDYPIMGATYLVTGIPNVDASTGDLYLQERSRQRAYPTGRVPKWLLPAVAGSVLLGVLAVAIMLRRRALTAALPTAWGYAEVASGPDQGKVFALRGDQIPVGRMQDPATAVALALDTNVSREHGLILRQGPAVFYQDTGSRNGSFVNEQPVAAGQRVPLPPGALIRVGPATVLRVGQAGAAGAQETQQAGTDGEWHLGEAPTAEAPQE